MNINPREFEEEDDDTWVVQSVKLTVTRPAVSIAVFSEAGKPTKEMVEKIQKTLSDLDALIMDAAKHILDNYSAEHFRKLGVSEELLVADSVEAVAGAVVLRSIYVFDPVESRFEMSFTTPWDEYHSFDVEFEDGEAVTCAVNG